MEENTQGISMEQIFTIISIAGDAKSSFYHAYELVKENKYEEAENVLEEANKTLVGAHKIQTELITSESQGNKSEVGILMIHAQDHLMNAILIKELVNHLISMQKEINELKK